MITNQTFDGLAFPVARVRYSNGNWNASIYRDSERTYRARERYDHATASGARNALPAALKCLQKALADNPGLALKAHYIAVPGDLDADTYTFTFVPAYLLNSETNR